MQLPTVKQLESCFKTASKDHIYKEILPCGYAMYNVGIRDVSIFRSNHVPVKNT